MKDKRTVIKALINEIHLICEKHDIEYYLIDGLALATYRDGVLPEEGIYSGRIVMTAKNFKRFVKVCPKELKEDRQIEWMGNNGAFSGLFMRYIDTSTVYYTARRLVCEKYLGMFIEIDVLRPVNRISSYCNLVEIIWQKMKMGYELGKGRWQTKIGNAFSKGSLLIGNDRFARIISKILLGIYSVNRKPQKYWIRRDFREKEGYYPSKLFESSIICNLEEINVCISKECEGLLKHIYGKRRYETFELKQRENGMNFFCDPNISYMSLDLDCLRDDIKSIHIKWAEIQSKRARTRKKLIPLTRKFLVTFYRYYFGNQLNQERDKLEELYKNGDFKKIDMFLESYITELKEYRYIYISEQLNDYIRSHHHDLKLDSIIAKTPKIYKKGIEIYDYNGEYVKTIGGNYE